MGRLPQDWFDGAPEVTIDREEITVVGTLAVPDLPDTASAAERAAAVRGRVKGFREDTRDKRIEIARELEHRTDKKVAWGVAIDGRARAVHPPRRAGDDAPASARAGGARHARRRRASHGPVPRRSRGASSSSGKNTDEWLGQLRAAMEEVERVRATGPDA